MKKELFFLAIVFLSLGVCDAFSQDWPDLGKFQEADVALGLPDAGEQRIVFMGNSITEGWIKNDEDFFKGNNLINRGISGQTTPQMLLRFRQDVIDLKPYVVFILAGINDLAGNTGPSTLKMIEDNLRSMTELAEASGIRVVLCTLLPSNRIPWRDNINLSEKVITLNNWIKEYSSGKGITVVDYYSALADNQNGLPEKYSKDGVHPNPDGYKIMEKLVQPIIQGYRN